MSEKITDKEKSEGFIHKSHRFEMSYDDNDISLSYVMDIINNKGLFKLNPLRCSVSNISYDLIGTEYSLDIYNKHLTYDYSAGTESHLILGNALINKEGLVWVKTNTFKTVSFEEVVTYVDKETSRELCFHLDLFR